MYTVHLTNKITEEVDANFYDLSKVGWIVFYKGDPNNPLANPALVCIYNAVVIIKVTSKE